MFDEPGAAVARHPDVAHHDIRRPRVHHEECSFRAAGGFDLITRKIAPLRDETPDRFLVIHNQHAGKGSRGGVLSAWNLLFNHDRGRGSTTDAVSRTPRPRGNLAVSARRGGARCPAPPQARPPAHKHAPAMTSSPPPSIAALRPASIPSIRPGEPFPLGATCDGRGTNFAVFSET